MGARGVPDLFTLYSFEVNSTVEWLFLIKQGILIHRNGFKSIFLTNDHETTTCDTYPEFQILGLNYTPT